LAYGSLQLRELRFSLPDDVQPLSVVVTLNGERLPVKWKNEGSVIMLTGLEAQLHADDRLKAEIFHN